MIEIHEHRDEQLQALVPVASQNENRQIIMTTTANEIGRQFMNEITETEVLLTAEEAAEEIGVSKSAIYVWTNRGYLKAAKKEGRFNYTG